MSAYGAGELPRWDSKNDAVWTQGAGADTMRRLAVPMIGGVGTSFVLELLVFPVIYYVAMRVVLHRQFRHAADQRAIGPIAVVAT